MNTVDEFGNKFWNFDDALSFVKQMSKSVGFYGRLLELWLTYDFEQQVKITHVLLKYKIANAVDFILFIEGDI